MVRDAGGDRDIAQLFLIFAAEDKARLAEWWANPGSGAPEPPQARS
jgi:hypothetical protein